MATALMESAMQAAGKTEYTVLGTLQGSELEYMKTAHLLLDRTSIVIVDDHVTLESGTGWVHTAPGHGVEAYDVCHNHYPEIPVVVPVDSHGRMTAEADDFVAGLTTNEANKVIAARLETRGNLFALQKLIHQSPHCWRCKTPVLFRATEQWFWSVDAIKNEALEAIKGVQWIPGWGEDRISSMVRDRNDWCISRQRRWGVPIPLFYCKDCGEPLLSKEAMQIVAALFREEGSDAWYAKEASELLAASFKCEKCGCTSFTKEHDIMDVWFDSGVTHAAVCEERAYLHWAADLYLEGADQYRGWFESSLLTSMAWRGKAPYKAVVTHGWVVDGQGRAMDKSLGKGILPKEIIDKYGADILRLWVASSDYHADIRISPEILKQLCDAYRKIRNTARYILGKLSDFDADQDSVPVSDMLSMDKWALNRLDQLIRKAREGYESFEFHQAYHAIHNFCVVDMSNFYLDVIKNRLYTEKKDSTVRRAAQTAMYLILDAMTRLIAPILAFTSNEIWQSMPPGSDCDARHVVYNQMPPLVSERTGERTCEEFVARWDKIHEIRDVVKKALENARAKKQIGASLDAKVTLYCTGELYDFLKSVEPELSTVFIVSATEIVNDAGGTLTDETLGLSVLVEKASDGKCMRCWCYSDTVDADPEHPDLCERCAKVLA